MVSAIQSELANLDDVENTLSGLRRPASLSREYWEYHSSLELAMLSGPRGGVYRRPTAVLRYPGCLI
jgi:hypothetical protein